jgi:hypothetical protein
MADDVGAGRAGGVGREILLQIAERRHEAALSTVARLTAEHPGDDPDQLAARLIRQCVRDLAIGGAISGGAAASPVAGATAAAAVLGTEGAINVARLGEMVMAIGIVHGHDQADADERAVWVAAALGASEGAAMGVTGLAARAGVRGGARLLRGVPTAVAATATGVGRTRRLAGRLAAKGGPWSLAALVPYGIGAGVGAAGNTALAFSVGHAARRYFGASPAPRTSADGGQSPNPTGPAGSTEPEGTEEIWEAEFIEEWFLDDGG